MVKILSAKECEQGKCPHCQSENIEYYGGEIIDDMVCYTFKCKECGETVQEWYGLDFIGMNINE